MQLFPNYADAIAGIESGGQQNPYAALGPVTAKGDRAYGRYQMMGNNIPEWTEQILGQRMTPDELMAHPKTNELQDYIFNSRFGDAVQKYGNPQDAASEWFTGKPLAQGANRSDILGTTGSQYVDKFNTNLAKQQGAAGPQSPMVSAFADPQGQAPAAPQQGQAPAAAQPQAPQEAPPLFPQRSGGLLGGMIGPDFGSKLQGLGASMVSISNPQAGANLMASAKDTRTLNMQRDMQEASYKSLVQRGVPPAEASAAALNPDIMKAVAAKYFDAKPWKVVQTGQNIFGQNEYMSHNEATNQFAPIGAGPVAPGAAPGTMPGSSVAPGGALPPGVNMPPAPNGGVGNFDVNKFQAAKEAGASPDDLRKMLPPLLRGEVDAVLQGRATTNPLARQGPLKSAIMMAAQAVDPTFDENTYQTRQTVAKGMGQVTPTSFGGLIAGGNKVVNHLQSYYGHIDDLDNLDHGQFLNGTLNNVVSQFSPRLSGELQKAKADARLLSIEAGRYLSGGHDSQAMRDQLYSLIDPEKLGPTQMKAGASEIATLIRGQLHPLTAQYNTAYGKSVDPDHFLGDTQKKFMSALDAGTALAHNPNSPDWKPTGTPDASAAPTAGFKVIKVH